jgi:5-(carboxyamino)imidazole ribonucleotide synthase
MLGILGGGQLGRMLALAAHDLGVATRCWDEQADAVAGHISPLHVDRFDAPSKAKLDAFLDGLAAVTTEWENVPVALLETIAARGVPVRPNPAALRTAQDRLLEKQLAERLGIAVPAYAPANSRDELASAIARVGLPCVVKTRRFGYDGKGQFICRVMDDLDACWAALGAAASGDNARGGGLIVEAFVRFTREVSIIAVRGVDGDTRTWPLVENVHAEGILRRSVAPAAGTVARQAEAEKIARLVLDALEYVGVLAVELFDTLDGLIFNEIAPRVHNSGHWTINASVTSQFENHARAALGLPLGDTSMLHPRLAAGMINLIGTMPDRAAILSACGGAAKLHDYAKAPRPGRKLGHINLTASNPEHLASAMAAVEALMGHREG